LRERKNKYDVAVVRVNFVKKGKGERASAKANIKYITYRRGKDGARITRMLFGTGGQMERQQAYEMINQAEEGSTFFRIKISPDPKTEDIQRDLLLREITEKTMALEERIGKPLAWVAAIHDDHTPIRHVHVLAVVKERLLPAPLMIQTATAACLEQRRELDLAREQQQEWEEAEWERER
jgi:hypothetical protein